MNQIDLILTLGDQSWPPYVCIIKYGGEPMTIPFVVQQTLGSNMKLGSILTALGRGKEC